MKKIVFCTRKLRPCPKRSVYSALKNFYQKIGISDLDEIQSKARVTMQYLSNTYDVDTYQVGLRLIRGRKTPIAMLKEKDADKPITINGKSYLRNVGDWVILIQSNNKAYIVVERCNIFIPNGWSEKDEDFIMAPATYEMFKEKHINDVCDTLN